MPHAKIEFQLEVEDGFPPISVETLNVRPVGNDQFEILNTPFFAKNIAYHDHVTADAQTDGRLIFRDCTQFSKFKAVSIILFDESLDTELLDLLRGFSCVIEYGEFGKLRMVALGVPPSADYENISSVFDKYESLGKISYAELVA